MICSTCNTKFKTLRTTEEGEEVRRERECQCGREITIEMSERKLAKQVRELKEFSEEEKMRGKELKEKIEDMKLVIMNYLQAQKELKDFVS